MKKYDLFIILLFICVLALNGCSKTVTERVPIGARLVASINFASNIDYANNKYYMVIANNPNYQLPFSPYEFIEPGIPPKDPQVDYFKFYSTWSAYVIVDAGVAYLVPGPFISSTETYSRIQISSPLPIGGNVSFQFRLDQVFGDTPPDVIYFDFMTVDQSRLLMDHLTPPSKSIMKYDGMIVSGSDEGTSSIDLSLDILDWSVSIQ